MFPPCDVRCFQSPTVKDYLKHVEELDRIYGSSSEASSAESISRKDPERKTLADVLAPSKTTSYTPTSIFKPQATTTSMPTETQKAPEPAKFSSGGSRKRRNDTAIDKAFKARGMRLTDPAFAVDSRCNRRFDDFVL